MDPELEAAFHRGICNWCESDAVGHAPISQSLAFGLRAGNSANLVVKQFPATLSAAVANIDVFSISPISFHKRMVLFPLSAAKRT